MLKAYKYRLNPTSEQISLIEKTFGSTRFIYNWALQTKIEAYQDDKKSLTYHDLCKKLTDLKKYGMAYRRGKGKDQKWFVNPYFFVMIALELDPEIYAKVILWLTDNFIENRNIAGEAYIKMCKSVSSLIKNKSELSDKIKIVAKAINFIVFNKHEDGIRNFATKNELNEIISIENAVGAIIDGEFVHSFEELRMYLGKEWKKRWGNPIMALK